MLFSPNQCLSSFISWNLSKINYEFSEDAVEILGIWDAPEPRYYFSTFTYKNHWSAFAIMSFFVGCSLLFKPIFIWGKDFYRSKDFVFYFFCFL